MKKLSLFLLSLFLCYSIGTAREFTRFDGKDLQYQTNATSFFIENKGQWSPEAKFLAQSPGIDAWLTFNGVTYDFYKFQPNANKPVEPINPDLDYTFQNSDRVGNVVKMEYLNSFSAQAEGINPNKGYYNYFIGNDPAKWASRVGLFNEVVMLNVYNGINVKMYYEHSNLRYDMIVTPDGNPNQIQMKFSGAEKIYLNDKGNLVIRTSIGDVEQKGLFAYQEIAGSKVEVECSFSLIAENTVGFEVGDYDDNYPLIIDPLIYSTFVSPTTSGSILYESTVNTTQNILITGGTSSTEYPVTEGAYQTTNAGSTDIFLTKLDAYGTELVFSTFIGGSSAENALGCAYDDQGDVYVTAYGPSVDIPVTPDAFQTTNGGGNDINVFKLSAEGDELIYGTYLGGSGADMAYTVAVDEDYCAYILGYTPSTDYPVSAGAFQTTNAGGANDLVMTKLNADGTDIVYSTYIGGSDEDLAYGHWVTPDGYCYIAGRTISADFPVTEGAFQTEKSDGYDALLLALNQDGTDLVFSTYLGGSGDEYGMRARVDANNNVYITGYTTSTDFPVTEGAFQITHGGGDYDCFVTKFNPTGTSLVYSTFVGGNGTDYGRALDVSSDGWAVIGGKTTSTDFPVTPDAYQDEYRGGADDGIVFLLNPSGSTLQYSTYFGGEGSDFCRAIAYDETGNAFPSGYSGSANFPTTEGAYQTTIGVPGGNNGWATRFELNATIATPAPSFPLNNSVYVDRTPTFEWETVENAVSFDLQVATQSNFDPASLVVNEAELAGTSFEVEDEFLETTKYYWRVRARDDEENISNWSITWNFITEGPLEVPVLTTPANGASGLVATVNFGWQSSFSATSYQLQIATVENFETTVFDIESTGTSYRVEGLTLGQTFYWRVRALNPYVTSDWSEIRQFSTGSFLELIIGNGTAVNTTTSYPAPYGNWYYGAKHQFLILASELSEAGGSAGAMTSLSFNIGALNSGSPLVNFVIRMKLTDRTVLDATWDTEEFETVFESPSYQNELGWNLHEFLDPFIWDGASNVLVDICFNNTSISNNQSTFYTTTSVNTARYYRADNATVCSAPGAVTLSTYRPNMKITLDASGLLPPFNLAPEKGMLGVDQAPLFDWTDVDGAMSYNLIVSDDINFDNLIINLTGIGESEYQAEEALSPTTMYYWRACAFDGEATSPWSQRWNFVTEGDLPAPTLISPEYGTTDLAPTTKLVWQSFYGASNFELQVAETEDFEEPIINETLEGVTSYITQGLAMSTPYFWRLRMFNSSNISDWCDPWMFTTGNSVIVGIGENFDTDYYNYVTPSPYSNWYHSARIYFLYTAEELLAGGAIPNTYITNFGWNVAVNQSSVSFLNPGEFHIRMKLSPLTQLNGTWSWEDWQTVWEPEVPFLAQLGWNMHECIDPLFWDGVSSVLVETCFSHWERTGSPNPQQYWSTTPVTRCQYRSTYVPDGPEIDYCEEVTATATQRPGRANIKLIFEESNLDIPTLISPDDGQLAVLVNPLFMWNAVEGAESYRIQVSLTKNFDAVVVDEEGILETEYQIPYGYELESMQGYYWRVNASDAENTSFWSFKRYFVTEGDLPEPVLLSPESGTTELAPSTVLTWEPYFAATGYDVQVALDEDFQQILNDATVENATSYITEGLAMSMQYWWRVRMFNSANTSEWCLPWTFTTGNLVVVGTGDSYDTDYYNYVSPSPYSNWYNHARIYFLYTAEELLNAGAVPNNFITHFGWNIAMNQSSVGPLNPGEFEIRMKSTPLTQLNGTWNYEDWQTVWVPESPWVAQLGWNIHECIDPFFWDGESGILVETCMSHWDRTGNPNPQQYWTYTPQVRCQYRSVYEPNGPELDYCSFPETANGSQKYNRANIRLSFEENLLGMPTLLSPDDGALGVTVSPLFMWQPIDGAESYRIQVATTANFETPVFDEEGLMNSEFQVPDGYELEEMEGYYWRVNASDAENTSFWSFKRYFVTQGELPAPTLISPENGSTNLPPSTTLTWEPFFAADGYDIQISESPDFETTIVSTSVNDPSYGTAGLSTNTQYYWRVRIYNDGGESPWCEPWSFTTGNLIVVGTGTQVNTTTSWPAPYGNYYWGAKHQLLLRQNELSAAGLTAGDLHSLGFDIATLNSTTALNNFTIRIKPTTLNVLDAVWDTDGFTTVYTNSAYLCSLGWNMHEFDEAFYWDGESNLLIDVCFNNSSYSSNQSTYFSATGYNSTRYYYGDNTTVCTFPASCYVMQNRPNIMFDLGPAEPLPEPPTLISPLDLTQDEVVIPVLEWSYVEEAGSYELQVSANSSFTNTVIDITTEDTEYQVETPLNYLTQYWWRVRSITEMGTIGQWSSAWSFTTAEEITIPSSWDYEVTDNFATIIVPVTIDPMIGDRPFTNGDAVGLFYERTPGNWYCAGYDVWDESGASIIVYGDDASTQIKDGYDVDELFKFRVWDKVELQEVQAFATYLMGSDSYQAGGFSMLASLTTLVPATQNIQLNSSWNTISSYISPTNANVASMFSDIESSVGVMKNQDGLMYNPSFSINEIGNWNSSEAYLINMLNSETLSITGEQIAPEENTISLTTGWNLSAYYRDNLMSTPTALASINANLFIAKNNAGGIYCPVYSINTVGNMLPGQGYYLYMTEAADLTYPANGAGKALAADELTPSAKYLVPQIANTGNNATLFLSIDSGDEVGIYNSNGNLIGSGAVYNGIAAITIWGDNSVTSTIDGATANELLTAKVYNSNANSLKDLSLANIQEITQGLEQDALYYSSNAIYFAKAIANNQFDLGMYIKNIPNPATGSTLFEFNLPQEGTAEIAIYSSTGELVASFAKNHYSAGLHNTQFDISKLASGVYNVVLNFGENRVSSFMIVNK